ncbi:MAG: GTPase, partial [Pseudomonadales bacterium]
ELPGTTRDLVRADLDLGGLPVEIVDTAGLRESGDEIEREGVRRALNEAVSADIVLLINELKDSNEWSVDDWQIPHDVVETRVVPVMNKVDLLAAGRAGVIEKAVEQGVIPVSALTGEGIDELRTTIRARAGFTPGSHLFTARKRHLLALDNAKSRMTAALELTGPMLPGELIAEELKAAHRALGDIVGQMSSDTLLGEIFSRFCIGK